MAKLRTAAVVLNLMLVVGALFAASAPAAPRIVGGSEADITDFPFQVAIWNPDAGSPNDGQYCAGVIVDATHVATAGHCVFDTFEFGQVTSPSDLRVLAGTAHLNSTTDPPYPASVKQPAVSQSSFNPSFDPFSLDYDVAVLTLAEPLYAGTPVPDGTTTIAPVPLIDSTQAASWANPSLASPVTVSGWGSTGNEFPANLQSVGLNLASDAACQSAYDDFGLEITPRMVCAVEDGEGACYGDSGGPLVADGGNVPNPPDDYLLAGLVGWGNDCADPDYPGVYTRIADPAIRNFVLSNPPQAPQQNGATTISGTAKPGQTLTCNAGSWTGSPTITHQFAAFTDDDFFVLTAPSAQNTYTVQQSDVGREIYCEVKATNAGGYGYSFSDTLIVGTVATGTPPASTIAGAIQTDSIAPQIGLTSKTCKRRRCTIKLSVFDPPPSGGIRKVDAKLVGRKQVKCTRAHQSAGCTRKVTRNLTATSLGAGVFLVNAGALKPGKYTVTLSATDNAGNRQAVPVSVRLRVKAPRKRR